MSARADETTLNYYTIANQGLRHIDRRTEYLRKVGQHIEERGRSTLCVSIRDERQKHAGIIDADMLKVDEGLVGENDRVRQAYHCREDKHDNGDPEHQLVNPLPGRTTPYENPV